MSEQKKRRTAAINTVHLAGAVVRVANNMLELRIEAYGREPWTTWCRLSEKITAGPVVGYLKPDRVIYVEGRLATMDGRNGRLVIVDVHKVELL